MDFYSQSLIESIEEKLDPKISDFFEATKNIYAYGYDTLSGFVKSVLASYDMISSGSYQAKYIKEIESRKKRRQNWLGRLKNNHAEYNYRDPKSFFNHISLQLSSYEGSLALRNKYGTVDIEKIIDAIVIQCEAWKTNRGLLIAFPNFPYIGKISVVDVFRSDVLVEIVRIIDENYGGNIKNVVSSVPTEMIMNPVFSSSHGKALVKLTADKEMIAELFSSENYTIKFFDIPAEAKAEFDVSGKTKIPLLDDVDMTIISNLINNAEFDLTGPQSVLVPTQTTTLSQICNAVYGHRQATYKGANATQRDSIKKRLIRMTYPITAVGDKGTIFSWAILSSVAIHTVHETGAIAVDYTLGPVLTRSLMEDRLLRLPSLEIRALETSAGRTLVFQLQLDRLTCGWNNRTIQKYKYTRFCQIMLLRSKSYQKNISAITMALEDIKQHTNHAIIKRYAIENMEIVIEFYPLTQDERLAFSGEDMKLLSENRL